MKIDKLLRILGIPSDTKIEVLCDAVLNRDTRRINLLASEPLDDGKIKLEHIPSHHQLIIYVGVTAQYARAFTVSYNAFAGAVVEHRGDSKRGDSRFELEHLRQLIQGVENPQQYPDWIEEE